MSQPEPPLNADSEPFLPGPPAPPSPPTVRRFFFGDDGLRAGWSVLLFLLLLAVTGFALTLLLQHLHLIHRPDPKVAAGPMTPRRALLSEFLQLLIVLIPASLMSLIERRPFARYGLPLHRLLPDFARGLAWGLVCLSALIGALVAVHGLAFDGLLLHGLPASLYAIKWALVFLLTGLGEEFLFRGYLLATVSRGIAGIARAMDPRNRHTHRIGFLLSASFFSVLLFMLAHLGNGGETAPGIIGVGLAGIVFAFSLYRTGSLWWGIGFHTAWDWAQSYLYGVADSGLAIQGHLLASHPTGSRLLSGGTVGPEGSWLVLPALLLAGAIIHFTLPLRLYPLTPDQAPPPLPSMYSDPYLATHPDPYPNP